MRIIKGWTDEERDALEYLTSIHRTPRLVIEFIKSQRVNNPLQDRFNRIDNDTDDMEFFRDIVDYCDNTAVFEEPKHIYKFTSIFSNDEDNLYVYGFACENIFTTINPVKAAALTEPDFVKLLAKTKNGRGEFKAMEVIQHDQKTN